MNWSEFEELPNSVNHNFEMLCRSIIWLNYGRFGTFAALANQPGVEFHLKLNSKCAIGKASQWFGWQCKWYDLKNGSLGNTRRRQIQDGIEKTESALPKLTDWVLWTRAKLSKDDQTWFYTLKTKMKLHLWSEDDVETQLTGNAEILRRTYFGDLILNATILEKLHEVSVAPIRKRWLPDVHQTLDSERTLRRMLCETQSWEVLLQAAEKIGNGIKKFEKCNENFSRTLLPHIASFIAQAKEISTQLIQVHGLLDKVDLEILGQYISEISFTLDSQIIATPRNLRAAKYFSGLITTNILADIKNAIKLLKRVGDFISTTLIAVVADAGGGKTQLAAEVTSSTSKRPAGILLHGRNLHVGKNLDDLATSILINGKKVESMEALLAGLHAAAQRASCRLPIVIDGLNEAEDPREWKPLLAALIVTLKSYANVLIICTLRTGAKSIDGEHIVSNRRKRKSAKTEFTDQALPNEVGKLEISGFGQDTYTAIEKYFEYYKINALDVELPEEFLAHPLTLRIFCEATNFERRSEVSVEAIPGSLSRVFELFIDSAANRISEITPSRQRFYSQDVTKALERLGNKLWNDNAREISEAEFRKEIDDNHRTWDTSLVNFMEQEGLILRIPGDKGGDLNIIPVYDALGGHLIANSILARQGSSSIKIWLENNFEKLTGNYPDRHPLASDIIKSLVALVPRRFYGEQLWQIVDEPLRTTSLRLAVNLEGKYLDAKTVDAIANLIRTERPGKIFTKLFQTRASAKHPLNSNFLDRALDVMSVSERDLSWSEWIRKNEDALLSDVKRWENNWKDCDYLIHATDEHRVRWMMWLLTSTSHVLRDTVTRALYYYGLVNPNLLFDLVERASSINDPYVFERMTAALYGAATALSTNEQPIFRKTLLPKFAVGIQKLVFAEDSIIKTSHFLTREYCRRLIELAVFHNKNCLTREEKESAQPPYTLHGQIQWPDSEAKDNEMNYAIHMDFERHVLGGLVVRDNENYTMDKIIAKIHWRIKGLGWSKALFQNIDNEINSHGNHGRISTNHKKTDRYGKKYSWISFFELRGLIEDECIGSKDKHFDERSWNMDIDPTFPIKLPDEKLIEENLFIEELLDLRSWLKQKTVPNIAPVFTQESLLGEQGLWVLLDGFCVQKAKDIDRTGFAFMRTILMKREDIDTFKAHLQNAVINSSFVPQKPELYHTFAGEIPWCKAFPTLDKNSIEFKVGTTKAKRRIKNKVAYLNGVNLNASTYDLLLLQMGLEKTNYLGLTETELKNIVFKDEFVDEVYQKDEYKTFNVSIPVCDINPIGHSFDDEKASGTTLAKRLAIEMKLLNIPQSYDLKTKDGIRATIGISSQPGNINNTESYYFIRKEILEAYLAKNGLILAWLIWGEREFVGNDYQRSDFQNYIFHKTDTHENI